jgi:hypothetical protein
MSGASSFLTVSSPMDEVLSTAWASRFTSRAKNDVTPLEHGELAWRSVRRY